ncbi:MAG: hypothetical protein HOO96_23755 [Polyangiaceae bacterium]|nr:hypothetical protein [Polyangiaceae bacterium]
MSPRRYARALGTAATVIGLGGCLVSIDESRIDAGRLDAATGAQDAGDGGPGVADGSDGAVSFCPQGAIFCDGFEGKLDDGTWERSGATGFLSYDTAPPGRSFSGSQSFRVAPTSTGSDVIDYLTHAVVLPDAAAAANVRLTFRALLESSSGDVVAVGLRMKDLQLNMDLKTGHTLETSGSTSGHDMSGGTKLPVGSTWHLVQVDLQRQEGKLTLSVDGTPGVLLDPGTGKGPLSKAQLLGTQLTLCLGAFYVAAGQSWRMWVDDVVVTAF